jgi:hypothetical protein
LDLSVNLDPAKLVDFGAVLRGQAREESPGEKAREEWEASERCYRERSREEMRQAWADFHADQIARHERTLLGLVEYHRTRLEALGGE